MDDRILALPSGYDKRTQATVALFAGQLDDQLKLLKIAIEGLTVQQLEWQLRPGMNTVGMLLTHLAIVEVWWINVATAELPWQPDGENVIRQTLGQNDIDDGLPLPADGVHPAMLKGKTLADYLGILNAARAAIHATLLTWHDKDLDTMFRLRDRNVSRMWTLYHVLEHFSGHFGQILLLKHMMEDAGILERLKKE